VSGGVARSAAQAAARPAADPAGEAHSTLARSRTNARWAGAITGSTFYIGMIPALLLIYCEQLAIVLKIAAIHGKDPCDAARIAEFLVIQGRYGSTAEAADALARLGAPAAGRRVGRLHRGVAVIRQLPELIGLTLRRIRNPLDAIIVAVEILSFFVPVGDRLLRERGVDSGRNDAAAPGDETASEAAAFAADFGLVCTRRRRCAPSPR
jgi:hypothetical protein